MNVIFLSPGYPPEMPHFVRGLREAGASVIGVGDQDESAIPAVARENLSAYVRVGGFADEEAILSAVESFATRVRVDRVECMWEPLIVLAARLRERFSLPGMTIAESVPFRDKEIMKQTLDAAGIRTPAHFRAHTVPEVLEAVERIGFPIIVKPIAGAGSKDTHRCESRAELEAILPQIRHVSEVSVEEFVDAEEFTFDTVCADGRILYYNVCAYRPRPLVARQLEWISPQTIALRNPDVEYLEPGLSLGRAVLDAMGFKTGFTHMEWYRRPDGVAVFGEIAARPPGAFTVDIMNYASDIDLFRGWANAVLHGTLGQEIERRYNCASIFKRAQGRGRIRRIDGLGPLLAEFGPHIVHLDLLPVGAQRRDWLQTLISDGIVVLRHPDLDTTMRMADRVGTDLQLIAS